MPKMPWATNKRILVYSLAAAENASMSLASKSSNRSFATIATWSRDGNEAAENLAICGRSVGMHVGSGQLPTDGFANNLETQS